MPIDFKPIAKIDFKPRGPVEPSTEDRIDEHGNIHKPDGTVVHSSFKGKERIDRRFVDTDKLRSSMINAASKTPFPRIAGALGEIPISAMELFNDPEAVAGGPLIKRGLQRINPRVAPSPQPTISQGVNVVAPPPRPPSAEAQAFSRPMTGSREVLPVKPQVSTLPTRAEANEILKVTESVPGEFEIVYRGGNLKGRETHSFWTTDRNEAIGYASLAKRPEDRILHTGKIPKGKYPAGDKTTGGNIPESWKDIQRAIPNEELDKAYKAIKSPLSVPQQVMKGEPGYDEWIKFRNSQIKLKEAPRIRTADPSAGHSIMAEIESMPKKMPQIADVAKSPSGVGDNVESLGPIRRVFSEARALQTSMDLSAPLRQGISQIHTKEFWKNLKPMFQAARSEEGFKRLTKEIEDRPTFSLMQRAGVEFTDVSKALAKREETMRGTFVEKWIPGVRQSNRAYTLFLNKMRADTFDRMASDVLDVIDEGVDVTKGAKAIAKFVNDATGRGSLGSWEKSAVALNDVFFSPKLIASRVNMLGRAGKATFESITRTGADDAVAKSLRKEALKSMIGYGGLGATSISLSLLNGAEGTDDPRSTDFGKLRIGNTRIDYTGGFQQYIRVAAQLASGQANIEGRIQDRNRLDVASRFLRNKLSPMISSVVDLMAGENVIGEETNLPTEMIELVTPLIIDDLIEVIMEDPKMLPLTTPSTFFGAGSQTYGRQNSTGMPSINLDMPKMPFISQ